MSGFYARGAESFTLDAERLLLELRRRHVTHLREVRLRHNRSRLLSISRDRTRLNAHIGFADAPAEILDAVAAFLVARPGSAAFRTAVRHIRAWEGGRRALERSRTDRRTRDKVPQTPRPGPCCATPAQKAFLRRLYERLNRERFAAALPGDIPIRLSARMTRRFGHVRYHRTPAGEREVVEIALQATLLRAGEHAELIETLLHEMAHVEAWLHHGHAGHGRTWRRIAARVDCVPRACRPAPR